MANSKNKLTLLRTANQCLADAANLPELKQLFGTFWHQGEVAILFADTGIGKSLLAVTIAEVISSGKSTCCGLANETGSQAVLYYDFELSDRMFQIRYRDSMFQSNHEFANSFYRSMIVPDVSNESETKNGTILGTANETFQKQLFEAIETDLAETGAKVLIVDNITALTLKTTTDADAALGLMRHLKRLQMQLDLSILVLAHTTKIPNYVPIQLNQLGGSKHLANFADSVFAIAKSNQDENTRYLKQLKVRNADLEYGQHQVIVIRKQKVDAFLGFEFVGTSPEMEHLVGNENANEKQQKSEMVIQLHKQGISQRQISEQTGIPLGTVNRYIQTSSNQ